MSARLKAVFITADLVVLPGEVLDPAPVRVELVPEVAHQLGLPEEQVAFIKVGVSRQRGVVYEER